MTRQASWVLAVFFVGLALGVWLAAALLPHLLVSDFDAVSLCIRVVDQAKSQGRQF
jgi:hypothetical protein